MPDLGVHTAQGAGEQRECPGGRAPDSPDLERGAVEWESPATPAGYDPHPTAHCKRINSDDDDDCVDD